MTSLTCNFWPRDTIEQWVLNSQFLPRGRDPIVLITKILSQMTILQMICDVAFSVLIRHYNMRSPFLRIHVKRYITYLLYIHKMTETRVDSGTEPYEQ